VKSCTVATVPTPPDNSVEGCTCRPSIRQNNLARVTADLERLAVELASIGFTDFMMSPMVLYPWSFACGASVPPPSPRRITQESRSPFLLADARKQDATITRKRPSLSRWKMLALHGGSRST